MFSLPASLDIEEFAIEDVNRESKYIRGTVVTSRHQVKLEG